MDESPRRQLSSIGLRRSHGFVGLVSATVMGRDVKISFVAIKRHEALWLWRVIEMCHFLCSFGPLESCEFGHSTLRGK